MERERLYSLTNFELYKLSDDKVVEETTEGEAKRSAEEEGKRMIMKASEEISKQKAVAIAELKGQVATLSVSIAEKLINNQLSNSEEQQSIIAKQVNSLNNNQQAIA